MIHLSPQTLHHAARREPLVSVVIPSYNTAPYLERAVRSALAQTMADLEVIVVDDASSDASVEVARRLARSDPRVRVLARTRNRGVSATQNRGMREARGEWIGLLHADDVWLPERLERLLAVADGADTVSDDVYRIHPAAGRGYSCLRGRWYRPLFLAEPCWLTPHDLVRHHLGVLKPLFRRTFVQRHQLAYNPRLAALEDFHFYLQGLLAGAQWRQVPEAYYLWYVRADAATSIVWELFERDDVLGQTRALLGDPRIRRDPRLVALLEAFIEEDRVNVHIGAIKRRLRRGQLRAALGALLGRPTDVPAVVSLVAKHLYAGAHWRWTGFRMDRGVASRTARRGFPAGFDPGMPRLRRAAGSS